MKGIESALARISVHPTAIEQQPAAIAPRNSGKPVANRGLIKVKTPKPIRPSPKIISKTPAKVLFLIIISP
jgi:hypothetical protein